MENETQQRTTKAPKVKRGTNKTSPASNTTASSATKSGGECDKCDGPHPTDSCPIFKKARDSHPDAKRGKPMDMGQPGGGYTLRNARVVRQPGDGSCLFHSMAYGIGGRGATALRRDIASFIQKNSRLMIADTPLEDWVRWDSGSSVTTYASRMKYSGWGGGIEMAACARLMKVNVHVYEKRRRGGGYERISCFDAPAKGNNKTVHVLYCGGCHYDALVPTR